MESCAPPWKHTAETGTELISLTRLFYRHTHLRFSFNNLGAPATCWSQHLNLIKSVLETALSRSVFTLWAARQATGGEAQQASGECWLLPKGQAGSGMFWVKTQPLTHWSRVSGVGLSPHSGWQVTALFLLSPVQP